MLLVAHAEVDKVGVFTTQTELASEEHYPVVWIQCDKGVKLQFQFSTWQNSSMTDYQKDYESRAMAVLQQFRHCTILQFVYEPNAKNGR